MRSSPITDTSSGVVACEEAVHSTISKEQINSEDSNLVIWCCFNTFTSILVEHSNRISPESGFNAHQISCLTVVRKKEHNTLVILVLLIIFIFHFLQLQPLSDREVTSTTSSLRMLWPNHLPSSQEESQKVMKM